MDGEDGQSNNSDGGGVDEDTADYRALEEFIKGHINMAKAMDVPDEFVEKSLKRAYERVYGHPADSSEVSRDDVRAVEENLETYAVGAYGVLVGEKPGVSIPCGTMGPDLGKQNPTTMEDWEEHELERRRKHRECMLR